MTTATSFLLHFMSFILSMAVLSSAKDDFNLVLLAAFLLGILTVSAIHHLVRFMS